MGLTNCQHIVHTDRHLISKERANVLVCNWCVTTWQSKYTLTSQIRYLSRYGQTNACAFLWQQFSGRKFFLLIRVALLRNEFLSWKYSLPIKHKFLKTATAIIFQTPWLFPDFARLFQIFLTNHNIPLFFPNLERNHFLDIFGHCSYPDFFLISQAQKIINKIHPQSQCHTHIHNHAPHPPPPSKAPNIIITSFSYLAPLPYLYTLITTLDKRETLAWSWCCTHSQGQSDSKGLWDQRWLLPVPASTYHQLLQGPSHMDDPWNYMLNIWYCSGIISKEKLAELMW